MEPHGSASRTEEDFLELEPDEELLCSVSDITEHLGRNITVVLDTALSEIRKMVSIRIRVLKMELHQKSEEIEILKARLESVQRDSKDPFPGSTGPPGDAGPRKADCNPASKHSGVDPRKAKTFVPGVKKENIDAICDYLMKDKNSRGVVVELEGSQSQAIGDAHHQEAEPDSLHLWTDGGMASAGPGHGDAENAADDIFGMLPSGSKRMYDYEWIAPMAYSSDLKVMKESGCESAPTGEEANDDDDDDDEDDGDDDNLSRRDGGGLEHAHAPLSHVQAPDFSMDPQNSPGEGEGPLRANADRPATGQPFVSSHTYICSLCGTFCPDAVFLEEHVKLIHPDSAAAAAAAAAAEEEQQQQQQQAGRPLQSTCCTESRSGGGGGGGGEQQEGAGGAGVGGGASGGPRGEGGGGPFKKENKLEGGYECGDCGRHFNYLGNLRQHQRIHTGEKPFVCPECGERFRHAARLKSHRLVHSGAQSPFPCPQCGKGFSVLSGLKRHQRVHTGEEEEEPATP